MRALHHLELPSTPQHETIEKLPSAGFYGNSTQELFSPIFGSLDSEVNLTKETLEHLIGVSVWNCKGDVTGLSHQEKYLVSQGNLFSVKTFRSAKSLCCVTDKNQNARLERLKNQPRETK